MNPSTPRPTDAELEILRVLWQRGPSTVRDVVEVLSVEKAVGYTTALKILQIMFEKGLVNRNESRRTHVYSAALAEEVTQRQLVDDLLQRAFGGSAQQLVMRALSSRHATTEELNEIQHLINELKEDRP